MHGKERLLQSALRAMTWAVIFSAVAVFWASVIVVLVAWAR
jgi:hypothetical protein